jgi:hypothetical protein
MAKQLRYGVRSDLAASDLFDLSIPHEKDQERNLTREEIRVLFDKGYETVSDVVRKDIDAEKAGFARDRFARNCGLETSLAKNIYRAAMEHLKAHVK